MQVLLHLSSHSSSLAILRTFYDTVESRTRGLSSLGKSEHTLGDLLIIMEKLPTGVQRNLAREYSNSPWNLPDLMAAILNEIRILESGLYSQQNRMPKSIIFAFSPMSHTDIAIASFGTTSLSHQKLEVTTIAEETLSGEVISMSVLIVPSIAAPIHDSISASLYKMPHLRELRLAHPVTSECSFHILLLTIIGALYRTT